MFVYLVWARRESLGRLRLQSNYWGLPTLGTLIFIWIVGNLSEVRVFQEFLVVLIIVVIAWTLLGTAIIRSLAAPIIFLFFAVPFGTGLIAPLQDFTSWFVIHALTFSHVPAVLENHTISLPSGVWSVAETCSGIRFLLSSFVLGVFFSLLMYRSWPRRLAFLSACVAVPIVGNGLRAYGTILLAYSTNNRVAVGVDHIIYGGLFSTVIQVTLLAIGLRWRDQGTVEDSAAAALQVDDDPSWRKSVLPLTVAMATMMLLAPMIANRLWDRAAMTTRWTETPVTIMTPWQSSVTGDMSWAPLWRGQYAKYSKSCEYRGKRVDVYWVLYSGRQRTDLSLPSDVIASTQAWAVVRQDLRSIVIAGKNLEVYRTLIRSGSTSRTVWTWYSVNGKFTANRNRVRLLQAKARLLGESAEVAVISVGSDGPSIASSEDEALQECVAHLNFENNVTAVSSTGFQSVGLLVPLEK
jgi:exosortase A